jgi:hypothetical protein
MTLRYTAGLLATSFICLHANAGATPPVGQTPAPVVQRSAPLVLGAPPLASASANGGLIVRAPVVLSSDNAILADGGSVDLKAVLRDKVSNAPLNDQTITFTIDGVAAAVIKTDATGLAWVKGHKAPPNMALGAHQMEARFAGTSTLSPITAQSTFTLIASSVDLKLDSWSGLLPTDHPQVAYKGDLISLQGALTRHADGHGLEGKKIRLLVGNAEVAPTAPYTIDAGGNFHFQAIWPDNAVGTVPVKVVFDRGDKLLPAASNILDIKGATLGAQLKLSFDFQPKIVTPGQLVVISGWLTLPIAGQSIPIAGQKVNFYANHQGSAGVSPAGESYIGSAVSKPDGNVSIQWNAKNHYSGEIKPTYYSFIARLDKNGVNYNMPEVDTQLNSLLIKPW